MSSKAPEMKRSLGVTRASNTVNWQYIRKVPKDLANHPHYKGQTFAVRETLGTPELAEANRLAAFKSAELESLWATLRAARTVTAPGTLSPQAVQAIAQALHQQIRATDAEQRKDPVKLAQALRTWWRVNRQSVASLSMAGPEAIGMSAVELRQHIQGTDTASQSGFDLPHLLSPEGAEELAARPKWQGLPPPLRDVLRQRNENARAIALEAFSRGSPSPFIIPAQRVAVGLGINLGADGWLSEDAQPLRDACQAAYLLALDELITLDAGRAVPMPETAAVPSVAGHLPTPTSAPTATLKAPAQAHPRKPGEVVDILRAAPADVFLRDVLNDWAEHGKAGRKPYPVKTVGKYGKAVERFEALTDNPSMAHIDRVCGAQFKRTMKDLKDGQTLTDATVRDTLINCGTLLGYYSSQTGKIPGRLREKLTDKPEDVPQQTTRDEWTADELKRLFGLPIWQCYELPATKNAGLDAAYWVPLLGLFTGARVTELCQLRVDDFTQEAGVWFLRMAVTAEGQSLKKRDSWRGIPLAQGLIDLGLIEYRQAMVDQGQAWLFPGVTKDAQNNAGGGLSKWFSSLKIKHGFRPEVVFHSFRGSLNTELMRRGITLEHRCKYIGQKPEGGVNVANYNKLKAADLLGVAQAIDFAFLNLPKVYKAPAWFPGWKQPTTK